MKPKDWRPSSIKSNFLNQDQLTSTDKVQSDSRPSLPEKKDESNAYAKSITNPLRPAMDHLF